ncbi:MAG: SDR family NAD(P)-dependent oxidoreductase [Opitutaceae bacterium]|nr:SDR family NAD(P)-dependent oxidoreductase [Opitutaceae bacterium]
MEKTLTRWRGKVALVTGASSGIGRAIAVDLGRLGLKVAITGRHRPTLAVVSAEIRRAGGEALILTGDQAVLDTNRRFFRRVRARWGGVDVLVNSSGVRGGTSVLTASLAELQGGFNLNVLAATVCMREAVADLRGRPAGVIINLCSMTGHRLLPGTPGPYAATKHALRIMTDGLRAELATEKLPIKVALLSPGLVDTPWHSRPGGVLAQKGAYPYEPLQPADIVAAVRYILAAPPRVQIGDIQLRSTGQPF